VTLRLHTAANARTLGKTRVLVFGVWLAHLCTTPYHELGWMEPDLFVAHGLMGLIPSSLLPVLISPEVTAAAYLLAVTGVTWVMVGWRGARIVVWPILVLMTMLLGLSKGLGGHVDHRELMLLYTAWIVAAFGGLDGFRPGRMPPSVTPRHPRYRAGLVLAGSLLALQYAYIGLARLFVGFPHVFDPSVMMGWLISRSVRPNPFGFELGLAMVDLPVSSWWLVGILVAGTLIELSAPALLFLRPKHRWPILLGLAGFHTSIFFMMNIAFWENVLLLLLFVERGRDGSNPTGRTPGFTNTAATSSPSSADVPPADPDPGAMVRAT
jgi:hypothetical protein